jgi:hypothetical protein
MDVAAMRDSTQAYLKTYIGLDDAAAARLVQAVCDAAQAELLGMVSGGGPYPSSMADLRALRLRYMCEAAERLLTTQEVAILFRTTDNGAQTLLTRMEVLYPAAVARYLDELVASTGKWEEAGHPGAYRYLIQFGQLGAWQHAISMLQQAGCFDVPAVKSRLTIEPPITVGPGKGQRDTLVVLGIPKSAKKK